MPVITVDAELADLIPQYLDNRREDLRSARQLLAGNDFQQLARMAHRIRGSAASYGFADLGLILEVLESAAGQQDAAAIARQLDQFESFLRTVRIVYN